MTATPATTATPGTTGTPGTTAPAPGATDPVGPVVVQIRLAGDVWSTLCALDRLLPGRGVAALLPDGEQVALFRDRADRLHAIDNRDPFSGAAVLSRGLTGSHEGRPFVASPLLKQRFDLESGRCLDEEGVAVRVYPVRAVPTT
ncbi:nitrite reductase small subunit NirD [Streptomyces sp. NPDC091377]|uniref:nitrite reductase small subunit NirD n=1 Tax=Streptomyces sp. NPDC091377 TaxID=3365995 RepID=UPI003817C202